MNIAIRNENLGVMNSLDVEIIKTLEGSFTRKEIEKEFNNLYYNKVIIDITAIKNYYDENVLFDFLDFWDGAKIVLVLNNTEFCNSPNLLKKLVQKGIYNFAKNASATTFLVNRPNTYEDVKKYVEDKTLFNPLNQNNFVAEQAYNAQKNLNQKIIGIKSLTTHAGATTLMYMMCQMLKVKYKVKGIECNDDSSKYLKCDEIISSTSVNDLQVKIKTLYGCDVIILDLNDLNGEDFCDEILYLVEPGIIKFNKLIRNEKNMQKYATDYNKLILVRNNLKNGEIDNLSFEIKTEIFASLNDFNDRINSAESVRNMLIKLGYKL